MLRTHLVWNKNKDVIKCLKCFANSCEEIKKSLVVLNILILFEDKNIKNYEYYKKLLTVQTIFYKVNISKCLLKCLLIFWITLGFNKQ